MLWQLWQLRGWGRAVKPGAPEGGSHEKGASSEPETGFEVVYSRRATASGRRHSLRPDAPLLERFPSLCAQAFVCIPVWADCDEPFSRNRPFPAAVSNGIAGILSISISGLSTATGRTSLAQAGNVVLLGALFLCSALSVTASARRRATSWAPASVRAISTACVLLSWSVSLSVAVSAGAVAATSANEVRARKTYGIAAWELLFLTCQAASGVVTISSARLRRLRPRGSIE